MARGAEEVVDDPTFTLYSPDEAPGDDCLPGKVFTLCTYTNKIENFKLYARDIWTQVECMSKIGHSRQNCTLGGQNWKKKRNSEHYGQTQIKQHWIKFIKNEQMDDILNWYRF